MITQYDPTVQATIKFLQLLKVKVNDQTVNDNLQNHPDWPSLLCIADTFTKWNIANGAGSINPYQLDRLPTPFLARVNDTEVPLVIVTDVTEDQVTLYHRHYRKPRTTSRRNFIDNWDGIYLIAEPNAESQEPDFAQNKRKALVQSLLSGSAVALLVGLLFTLAYRHVSGLAVSGWQSLGYYAQLGLLLAGTVVSTALIWYDVDKNNPLLKRVCTNLAKSDCNAVLTSKGAKVFGWLSWSEVGLFYFAGGLLTMVLAGGNAWAVAGVVGWLNVLALPYTLFSLYYQGQIAKQWCALCLVVQAILVLGGLTVATSGLLWPLPSLGYADAAIIILLYAITPLIWYSLKPILLRMQESKSNYRQYLRLKFNSELFSTLLKNQKKINSPLRDLGITLGNPNASNTLVKVCSTYCGPCSKAHPEIEKLLEANDDLQVRIIFLAPHPEVNTAANPIRHLLAIAEQHDTHKLQQALNDWYLPNDKDYERFAAQYPLNGELQRQQEHVVAMNSWCEAESIMATPTIFLNGYQLPSSHTIEDLHYLLLDLPELDKRLN